MAKWLNHVTIAVAAGSGSATDTVDPHALAAGQSVVSGALFAPTAGRPMLAFIYGPVTSTNPTGWTPIDAQVNNGGLYLFQRDADGTSGDRIITTHNASGWATVYDFYEFPAGSFGQNEAGATGVANGAGGPSIGGLIAPTLVIAAGGFVPPGGSGAHTSSWAQGVKIVETEFEKTGVPDGYFYSAAYIEDYPGSSAQVAWTSTPAFSGQERMIFALTLGATPPPPSGTCCGLAPGRFL